MLELERHAKGPRVRVLGQRVMHGACRLRAMRGDGLCACGCGERPAIAKRNDARRGDIKGQPYRYCHGHATRKPRFPSPLWIAEDCGYETECWVWQGNCNDLGYGWVRTAHGQRIYAHRVAWVSVNGPIPPSLEIDHLCRIASCVRAEHLEVVPGAVNTQRGAVAKLTPEIVRAIRADSGTQRELGPKYGVDPSTICRVRKASGRGGWENVL